MRHLEQRQRLESFKLRRYFCCSIAICELLLPCGAFSVLPSTTFAVSHKTHSSQQHSEPLPLFSSSSSPSGDINDNDTEPNEVVTKEMFLRDLLETGDEIRIRKKGQKGGGGGKKQHKEYKVMDNRDILPFAVQLQTPEPYVHADVKRQMAQKAKKKKHDAVEEQITSRLYMSMSGSSRDEEDNTKTLLGEFNLDKHTTTGDLLLVGGHEYKVIRHRCQYKYAGGQRFVMVRKILEVKEVGRLYTESLLKKQFAQTCDDDIDVSEKFI